MMTFDQMIDLTSWRKLCLYLDGKDPEIKGCCQVYDELTLIEVGEVFENGNVAQLERWFDEGKVKFIANVPKYSIIFDVPANNCVYCLRLEPFYLFKDLKKPYA